MAELQNPDPLVEAVAKARAEASRRPDRTGFGTLNSTLNGKHFYSYSGVITVPTADTTMIIIPNIGERDILYCLEVGGASTSADLTLTLKSNNVIIYKNQFDYMGSHYGANPPDLKFILPANTSLEVICKLSSGSQPITIASYGDYL